MPQTVTFKNGTRASFPDDASPEEIQDAEQRYLGNPPAVEAIPRNWRPTTLAREVARPMPRFGEQPIQQSELPVAPDEGGIGYVPRAIGQGLAEAGRASLAAVGDVAATMGGTPEYGGNLRRWSVGGQLPVEQAMELSDAEPGGGAANLSAHVAAGFIKSVPKLVALGAAPESLLAQSVAAGGLFGLDDKGDFHVKDAVIGALLPSIGHYSKLAAAVALTKAIQGGAKPLENHAAQWVVEQIGQQSALDTAMIAADSPQIIEAYRQDPKKGKAMLSEIIGQNLIFSMLGLKGLNESIPTETKAFIAKHSEKYADLADRLVAPYIQIPDLPARQAAIEQSWQDLTGDRSLEARLKTGTAKGQVPAALMNAMPPREPGQFIQTQDQLNETIPPKEPSANSQSSAMEVAGSQPQGPAPQIPVGSPPPILVPPAANGQTPPAPGDQNAAPVAPPVAPAVVPEASAPTTPVAKTDLEVAHEPTESLVARTAVGPERNAAFTARREASVREASKAKSGDILVRDDGTRVQLDELGKKSSEKGEFWTHTEGSDPSTNGGIADIGAEIQAGGRIEPSKSKPAPVPAEATPVAPVAAPAPLAPDMPTARRIVEMTPEEFMAQAKAFNGLNLKLGENATAADLAELRTLRDKAEARRVEALNKAKASGLDADKNAALMLSSMPQFYNEAIKVAEARLEEPKAPELMTPDEWHAATVEKLAPSNAELKKLGFSGKTPPNPEAHRNQVANAALNGKPVNAAAVDAYKTKLPEGYVREGDQYVYRPEAKPPPVAQPAEPAAGKEKKAVGSPLASKIWNAESLAAIEEAKKEHARIGGGYENETQKARKLALITMLQNRLKLGTQAAIKAIDALVAGKPSIVQDLMDGKDVSGPRVTEAAIPNSTMLNLGYEKVGRTWKRPTTEPAAPPAPETKAVTGEPPKKPTSVATVDELRSADDVAGKASAEAERATVAWATHIEEVVNPLKAKIRKLQADVGQMESDARRTTAAVKGKQNLTKKKFLEQYGVATMDEANAAYKKKTAEWADLEKQLEDAEAKRKELDLVKERRRKEWSSAATRAGDLRREVYPSVREGDTGKSANKPLKIGDDARIMGVDSVLAKTETIGGVRYDLFNGAKLSEKRSAIRVTDADSGKTITLEQHPDYDSAESKFNKTVEDARKSEEPTPEPPAEKPARETISDKANALADKLEGLKANFHPEKGELGLFGVAPKLWDSAVSAAQAVIRAGGTVADAIAKAISHIKANFTGTWDEAGARAAFEKAKDETGFETLKEGPPPVEIQRAASQQRQYRNRQVFGAQIGAVAEIETRNEQTRVIKDNFFDGQQPVTSDRTEKAWKLMQDLTGPNKGAQADEVVKLVMDVTQQTSADAAPVLLKDELAHYALQLAAKGEPAMLRSLVLKEQDFEAARGGTQQAGRTLAAQQEFSSGKLWTEIRRVTADRARLLGQKFRTGQKLFDDLMATLDDLRLNPKDVADAEPAKGPTANEAVNESQRTPEGEKSSRPARERDEENLNQRIAAQILDWMEQKMGAEVLLPEKRKNEVREIVKEFLSLKVGEERFDPKKNQWAGVTPRHPIVEESFMRDMQARLEAVEVEPATARELAKQTFERLNAKIADRNSYKILRAGNQNRLGPLIEELLNTPYRAQHDPAWRERVATEWLMGRGLSREQAKSAAELLSKQFDAALIAAGEKAARQAMEGHLGPDRMNEVIKAIRLGLTDPNKVWSDSLIIPEGFKPLSPEEHKRAAELELKRADPSLSPPERAALESEMMGIFRHAGKMEGQYVRRWGEGYVASLLSGIRTGTVQLGPVFMAMRDLGIKSAQDPKNALKFAEIMANSYRGVLKAEFKYAWQKDAYGFHLTEITREHEALKTLWERLDRQYESASPAKKATIRLRQIWAMQWFVSRFLNSIDQAMMATNREWKLAFYAHDAFKAAGMNTTDVSQLVDAMSRAKAESIGRNVDNGMPVDQATVRANHESDQVLRDFFSNNNAPDNLANQVIKAAEMDVYSMVGRRAKGIGEQDEGMLSRYLGINSFMEALTKSRGKGGVESITATAMFGFVNVPMRTMRYWAGFGPYGLLRSGVDAWRKNRGYETFWKQSYGNELQARQRLREAIAGTVVLGLASAWAVSQSTADKDAGKKLGMYITGYGPQGKNERDAWTKEGWKPYALNFVFPDWSPIKKISIPITRAGEAIMFPFMIAAAMDDAHWKVKEAAAKGKKIEFVSTAVATLAGTIMSMTGQRGILQTVGSIGQALQSGSGIAGLEKMLARQVGSIASATLLPFKQMLQSISDMFIGPMDASSASAIVANQFPIVGLPWQKLAVNRFGDQMYDRTWYGRIAQTGVPIAFQVTKTPENERLYNDILLQKGAAPPELRRYLVEERFGPMTNEQFAQYGKISGDSLKKQTLAAADSLKSAPPEQVQAFLRQAASNSDAQAAAQLHLVPIKAPAGGGGESAATGGGGSGGAGAITPAVRAPRASARPVGRVRYAGPLGSGGARRVASIGAMPVGRRLSLGGGTRQRRLVSGRLRVGSRRAPRIRLGKSKRRVRLAA